MTTHPFPGAQRIDFNGGSVELEPGDTFTMPICMAHTFVNVSREQVVIYVVRELTLPLVAATAPACRRSRSPVQCH